MRDNLPYGNMDSWAAVKSCETRVDLSTFDGIELSVRGDGKLYRFAV